jgi:hypothetical protein
MKKYIDYKMTGKTMEEYTRKKARIFLSKNGFRE